MEKGLFAKVDYERLVAAYQESLTTVLRGFRPDAELEFLETWVHEEDHVKSLLNIAEAAECAGLSGVSIAIGPATLRTLELSRLQEAVARMGEVSIEPAGEGINFRVRFGEAHPSPQGRDLPSQASLPEERQQTFLGRVGSSPIRRSSSDGALHPVYRDRLQRALTSISHEGPLQAEEGFVRVGVSVGGVTLMALMDPASHQVKRAAFGGAPTDLQRGLLELLCGMLEGKPIQECSDHAVIRLEYVLRDHSQPPPVPGILTPQNADPAFALPTRLVRKLLAEYQRKRSVGDTQNFYDQPASAHWSGLSQSQRIEQLEAALCRHPAGSGVDLVRLEGVKRAVLKFQEELESNTKQERLLKLEEFLKRLLEPTLELYMEPKTDQNRPRQVKGVQL